MALAHGKKRINVNVHPRNVLAFQAGTLSVSAFCYSHHICGVSACLTMYDLENYVR